MGKLVLRKLVRIERGRKAAQILPAQLISKKRQSILE